MQKVCEYCDCEIVAGYCECFSIQDVKEYRKQVRRVLCAKARRSETSTKSDGVGVVRGLRGPTVR